MATKLPIKIGQGYYKNINKLDKTMEKGMMMLYKTKIIPIMQEYYKAVENATLVTHKKKTTKGIPSVIDELLKKAYLSIDSEILSFQREIFSVFNASTLNKISKEFVTAIQITQKRNLTKDLSRKSGWSEKKIAGINPLKEDKGLSTYTNAVVKENVKLIKSIPDQYFSRIEKAVRDGLEKGRSTADIAKDINSIDGITDRRAKFIVRDQLGSIYGQTTKQRQQNLGLKKFVWIDSDDERVRESHKGNNDKEFDWETGANGKYPGTDFNCRCTAETSEAEIEALFEDFE